MSLRSCPVASVHSCRTAAAASCRCSRSRSFRSIGLIGAAVDYSRANSIRSGVQGALDATALAMAKLAPTLTQSQLQTQSSAYFQALFSRPDAKNLDRHADLHHRRRLAR